ncbi:MAG: PHP domain-containing protein [Desulfovibrio sp.]|jgi:predicted metal-dependent phosphoesterase TrpH|nr:PHP domain-containing protein [Desulfovibrio sp.]
MIIDLHTHEELYSADSSMSLEEAVDAARERGLDGLCVTDHSSLGLAGENLEYLGFPVFIGVEMWTDAGDIVVFGLDELPERRLSAPELIALVAERGGFCFAAHPFRSFGGGVGDLLYSLKGLNGVETANGMDSPQENSLAARACERLGLAAVGGSDAHRTRDVGKAATWFPEPVATTAELVAALRSGQCRPLVLQPGKGHVPPPWMEKKNLPR